MEYLSTKAGGHFPLNPCRDKAATNQRKLFADYVESLVELGVGYVTSCRDSPLPLWVFR